MKRKLATFHSGPRGRGETERKLRRRKSTKVEAIVSDHVFSPLVLSVV